MTTDLEKRFFDTFEIELIEDGTCDMDGECINRDCHTCQRINKFNYPQITDHILLELICILTRWHLDEREPYEIMSINIERLKNQILSDSLYIAKDYRAKKQVQELFKGGNNG